jgi:hypothetical protein
MHIQGLEAGRKRGSEPWKRTQVSSEEGARGEESCRVHRRQGQCRGREGDRMKVLGDVFDERSFEVRRVGTLQHCRRELLHRGHWPASECNVEDEGAEGGTARERARVIATQARCRGEREGERRKTKSHALPTHLSGVDELLKRRLHGSCFRCK